jgi:hypothetical protein
MWRVASLYSFGSTVFTLAGTVALIPPNKLPRYADQYVLLESLAAELTKLSLVMVIHQLPFHNARSKNKQ